MKKQNILRVFSWFLLFFLLTFFILLFQVGCDKTITPTDGTAEGSENTGTIRLGIHYEYPFGGMATRPEWMPKGEADWRRDLAKINETGLNSIRIRIGMDSDLDEVGMLLDIAHENGLTVLFGLQCTKGPGKLYNPF